MKLLETRDDVTEAWRLAAEYRDVAVELGHEQLFTVRKMSVAPVMGRMPRTFGVYMLESGDDAALRGNPVPGR